MVKAADKSTKEFTPQYLMSVASVSEQANDLIKVLKAINSSQKI
jgi:hypothetical protein